MNSKKKVEQSIKVNGPWIAIGLLSLLIVWTLISTVSSIIQLKDMPTAKISHRTAVKQPPLLATGSLFGKYNKTTQPQKADIGSTVVGLIADPLDPESSTAMAIVKNSQGKSKIVRVGNILGQGYKITKILTKKIIMKNSQGFFYYLPLLKRPSLEFN